MRQRCGLFGKLPACGDFIATDVPRAFLERWEPWLQAGLAASQAALGAVWLQTYLVAPIWRFDLDVSIMGRQAVGALMPSVDSAGRCFPLTLVACAAVADTPHADEAWFAMAEHCLLGALSPGTRLPAVLESLGDVPWPATSRREKEGDAGVSVWSTAGGSGLPGWSFQCHGLPPAETMTSLLEGQPRQDAPSFMGGDR